MKTNMSCVFFYIMVTIVVIAQGAFELNSSIIQSVKIRFKSQINENKYALQQADMIQTCARSNTVTSLFPCFFFSRSG